MRSVQSLSLCRTAYQLAHARGTEWDECREWAFCLYMQHAVFFCTVVGKGRRQQGPWPEWHQQAGLPRLHTLHPSGGLPVHLLAYLSSSISFDLLLRLDLCIYLCTYLYLRHLEKFFVLDFQLPRTLQSCLHLHKTSSGLLQKKIFLAQSS